MAKAKSRSVEDLLQDILIVQLAGHGLTQHEIREIAGVDMNRVGRIMRYVGKRKKE